MGLPSTLGLYRVVSCSDPVPLSDSDYALSQLPPAHTELFCAGPEPTPQT